MNGQMKSQFASKNVMIDEDCFITMKVLSITEIREIDLSNDTSVEIKLKVECLSPVNEVDTFATINRYFEDGGNFDYEMSFNGNGFVFKGSLSMCNGENIDNIKAEEYKIPLSSTLKALLKNGTYGSVSEPGSIMVDAWFGERCNTEKAAWVTF